MRTAFPPPVPEIPVRNLADAIPYYRDTLGFTVDWNEEDLGLAGISRGDCRMFLAAASFRCARGNVGPALTWLNFDSKEQVDAQFREWRAHEALLHSAPESKPWGLYEFTAADPDGNLFRVFFDFATVERRGGATGPD